MLRTRSFREIKSFEDVPTHEDLSEIPELCELAGLREDCLDDTYHEPELVNLQCVTLYFSLVFDRPLPCAG